MSTWKKRAAQAENELANLLWEMGYAVVRGPSSGSGARRRFQPDLVAVKDGKVLVIEVKTCNPESIVYVPRAQVEGLREFARRAGGSVFIALKIRGHGWRLHRLEDLESTRGGGVKVRDPFAGMKPRELDEILFPGSRRITEFL